MAQPTSTTNGHALGTCPAGTKETPVISSPRVYAVGDSFTFGGNAESNGNTGLSWRQYVAEMCTTSGVTITKVGNINSLAPDWLSHRAVSGQTINTFVTVDFASPVTYLNAADPDIILLCSVGYNDINGGASGATTLTRLTALLDLFRAFTNGRGVTPRIVVSYLFYSTTSANNTPIDAFNAGLAAVVATQQGLGQKIVICDPRPALDNGTNVPIMRADGLHPGDRGYRLWARVVFAAMINAIGLDAEWGRPTS